MTIDLDELESRAGSPRGITYKAEVLALIRAVRALEPFAAFADHLDCKLPQGISDDLYAYQNAKGYLALKFSDCVTARTALTPFTKGEKK